MTITDITTNAVLTKGKDASSLGHAFCIAAALAFARDCARNGSFDAERYGNLAENWLKEIKD